MRVVRSSMVLMCVAALAGCAVKGAPISPYGRHAKLSTASGSISGELIAVSPDTIWLLTDSLRPLESSLVKQVKVQRHTFGFGRTMRWMSYAGLGTGAALMVSCISYESSNDGSGDGAPCVIVVPVTWVLFATAGLIFGGINEMTSVHRLSAADADRLRPFARYPQGLPDSVRRLPNVPTRVRR